MFSGLSALDTAAIQTQITSFLGIGAVLALIAAPLAVRLVVIGVRGIQALMGRK